MKGENIQVGVDTAQDIVGDEDEEAVIGREGCQVRCDVDSVPVLIFARPANEWLCWSIARCYCEGSGTEGVGLESLLLFSQAMCPHIESGLSLPTLHCILHSSPVIVYMSQLWPWSAKSGSLACN